MNHCGLVCRFARRQTADFFTAAAFGPLFFNLPPLMKITVVLVLPGHSSSGEPAVFCLPPKPVQDSKPVPPREPSRLN